MKLEFFGAAGEVTGSCHILHVANRRVLLDCGMIQGSPASEARNHDPFPFDPAGIDAVVLSHAHIDHSGRLPLLVKRGYKGPIYAQNATLDLCRVLLADAGYLQEQDNEWENRRRKRDGLEPVAPLYTVDHAAGTMGLIQGMKYNQRKTIVPEVEIRLRDAGHILGSAIVEVFITVGAQRRKIVFSGDLGQYDTPILHDPAAVDDADLIIMESTYGDRTHRDREHTVSELGDIVRAAAAGGGNVLIPAFAVGRTQEILYHFGKHYNDWDLDDWHIFVDSPLAIQASEIYWSYPHLYDEDATRLRRKFDEMPELNNLYLTETSAESRVINRLEKGAIVIAGSGMCNGGRIVHHLKHNLHRPECHVVFTGYQGRGSVGRRMVDGEGTVELHGQDVPVKAQVHTVGGLSAHGDKNDLMRWYANFTNSPPVYLVHGEPSSAAALKSTFEQRFGNTVIVAEPGLEVDMLAA